MFNKYNETWKQYDHRNFITNYSKFSAGAAVITEIWAQKDLFQIGIFEGQAKFQERDL